MQLPPEDVLHFFRLQKFLMFFVNQQLRVVDEEIAAPEAYASLPTESRYKVHEALLERMDLLDTFADENPFHLDAPDLEIVRSWRHRVTGTFYVFRQLRNYTVFLSETEPVEAYGVLALIDSFEELIGPDLPRRIKTTLLPYKGRIIYDGIMMISNIYFGGGFRRGLNESYREAKERSGIITTLPPPAPKPRLHPVAMGSTRKPAKRAGASGGGPLPSTSGAARLAHDRVVALTDAFCRDYLDDEYAALCRKMAEALARKRPSPLTRGKPESWAAGIVRTIGSANFLDDPSQTPHMRLSDIAGRIGVSDATCSAKATEIRKLLKVSPLDPGWTLPSQIDRNPLVWMIEVNGLAVDARWMPRPIQEEAFRKGLIPYIPADRAHESPDV